MRHARRDRRDRAAEQRLDRAMMMAAQDALDVAVRAHELGEPLGAFDQADAVHMAMPQSNGG